MVVLTVTPDFQYQNEEIFDVKKLLIALAEQVFFHFVTENGEDRLKEPTCRKMS